MPAKLARKQRTQSVLQPEHFLTRAHALTLQRQRHEAAAAKPPPPPPLPAALDALLLLQQSDGRWEWTDGFVRALGSRVPDVPVPGMAAWRWATVLSVAFLRRHPEVHDRVARACELAEEHIDESLLALARDSLPPAAAHVRYTAPLDDALVRVGRWREAEQQLMASAGYRAFLAHPDEGSEGEGSQFAGLAEASEGARSVSSATRSRASACRASASRPSHAASASGATTSATAVATAAAAAEARREHRALLAREFEAAARRRRPQPQRDDGVLVCMRRVGRWGELARSDVWHPARVTRAREDGSVDVAFLDGLRERAHAIPRSCVLLRQSPLAGATGSAVGSVSAAEAHNALPQLAEQWLVPLSVAQERKRLRRAAQRRQTRPWEHRFHVTSLPSPAPSQPRARSLSRSPSPRRHGTTVAGATVADAAVPSRCPPAPPSAARDGWTLPVLEDSSKCERAACAPDAAAVRIANALADHERCAEAACALARECARLFRSAETARDKVRRHCTAARGGARTDGPCFAQLIAFQPLLDALGRVRRRAVAVVWAVQEWRGDVQDRPFVWRSRPCLLRVRACLA